jgi:hypothetical protein
MQMLNGLQTGVTKWLWRMDTQFVIYHRHAHHQLNIKHFNVVRTKLVLLIKVGLTFVQRNLGGLGKQLLIIARRFRQAVKQAFQQGV